MNAEKTGKSRYLAGKFSITRIYYRCPGNCHWTWMVFDIDQQRVVEYKDTLKSALRFVAMEGKA